MNKITSNQDVISLFLDLRSTKKKPSDPVRADVTRTTSCQCRPMTDDTANPADTPTL